jgi:hypothetical protein
MSNTTDEQRIKYLEEKATQSYIDNTDWGDIFQMLDKDEQDEYIRLTEDC